ncbi:2'-5' RNA ligase family protein [Streptomyces sp. NPDC048717]|uniref:2'-5' RNA ligase family protein n=1 Tax=Streptomyces sp. NPDC048717 TaxID=3154928 RepID=UPI003420B1F9
MDAFVPKYQGHPWPSGTGVLHVYALPRPGADDDFLDITRACRPVMGDYPITPQYPNSEGDAGLLHLTLEMLADAPTTAYNPPALRQLTDALEQQLADVEPITTMAGPPIGNRAGIVIDVWPDEDIIALTDKIRTAIRQTRGDTALRHSGGRPHISLGYAHAAASSDPLNSRLRAITPRRAPLHIDRVHLLDVTWTLDGHGGWRMSWTPIAEIPLGTHR